MTEGRVQSEDQPMTVVVPPGRTYGIIDTTAGRVQSAWTRRWEVLEARFLDQISVLYEHLDCDEGCSHGEGDRRAAAFAAQYLKEIVYEEGFRPEVRDV